MPPVTAAAAVSTSSPDHLGCERGDRRLDATCGGPTEEVGYTEQRGCAQRQDHSHSQQPAMVSQKLMRHKPTRHPVSLAVVQLPCAAPVLPSDGARTGGRRILVESRVHRQCWRVPDDHRHGAGVQRTPPLAPLLPVLRDLPGLSAAVSAREASLVVPTAAQAGVIAAAVDMRGGPPIVVAVPLASEAERLAGDLAQFLPTDSVMLFPAWETLPFERVSPGVETMGARVEALWRLRTGDPTLRVVVAPARALVQRLGPHVEDTEPIDLEPGSIVYSEDLVAELVAMGYRREYQVEHRGEVAVRGSIVDVFPATADHPVRIDLWGDEVDRLTNFSVADQRATDSLGSVRIFPARELLPTDEVRRRAEKLIGSEPWGREQWQRIADGETFDGMEAWSAWLADREHVLYDLVPDDSLIVSVDPRRIRDRAGDIADEEASLAGSLSRTWDLTEDGELPRIHLPFDRLLTHTGAHHLAVTSVADSPDSATVDARSWPRAVGDAEAVVADISNLLAGGSRVVVCAEGTASVDRMKRVLGEAGLAFSVAEGGEAQMRDPGGWIVDSGLDAGCVLPGVQPGAALRGRSDGSAAHPPSRSALVDVTPSSSSRISPRAATWYTITTGWRGSPAWSHAPWAAPNATTCCSSTRGTTSCTCPPSRSTRCGSTPVATRRRSTRWVVLTSHAPRPRCDLL